MVQRLELPPPWHRQLMDYCAGRGVARAVIPSTIYTHHAGDLNIDHTICHRAVLAACRPLPAGKLSRHLRAGAERRPDFLQQKRSLFYARSTADTCSR
jgi:LmbE family N-acetylglucosaminyl deacetylase